MRLPQHEAPPVSAMTGWRPPAWLLAAGLALLTLGLYWPAVHHGFVYDDEMYVVQNVRIHQGLTLANLGWALTHTVGANWHPVTVWSHMLDCQMFGLNPWGPHLVNLLLHAANTVLVFLLLWRLTGALGRSVLVAALFGVHPLHVESVAWVAERKDMLSGFFGLLTLLAYVRYAQIRQASRPAPPPRAAQIQYGLALLWFALGLMSKPMLVTWPAVMLLLDFWPLRRGEAGAWARLLREKIPFVVLAIAAGGATFMAQRGQGAMAAAGELPVGARLGNALISYCRYLGKIFWPVDLAVFYPHPVWWPAGAVIAAGVSLVVISVLVLREWRRRPYLPMGWLWYLGTLVPVIGLVQVGSQAMADRYTYLPSLGLFVLAVWGGLELLQCWRGPERMSAVVGVLLVAGNLVMARQQLTYWQNGETLFRHALAVTPDNSIARCNLGAALSAQNRNAAALEQYQKALQLNSNDAETYLDCGNLLLKQDQVDAAIARYEEALQRKPEYAEAGYSLGLAFEMKGLTNAALKTYQNVLQLQPSHAPAHNKLGSLLLRQGQLPAAISQFQEAVHWNPDFEEAHYNLGFALNQAGQSTAAIGQYQEAIRLRPDHYEAHYNLGNVLARLGQMAAAAGEYQAALRLQPDRAEAHNNLGFALFAQGHVVEAVREFREALRLQPDYPAAQKNLDRALAAPKPRPAP
ncbi:MAG TPA: tetratricopeptide repeat protein [Dongiaceae bacterium]|nr:tetratricopeptide repeat protein [Dongiaceae bacterium]